MALRKSEVLLPEIFRTDRNRKFLNATVDQLISEPQRVKINSFVGRLESRNFTAGDSYVREINNTRQNYQLEPGVIYRTPENSVESVGSYIDFLNGIRYKNGNINQQDSLFEQEYYNWNGFIDLDKLVNYGEYFWLPSGPDSVQVFAGDVDTQQTFEIVRNPNSTFTVNSAADSNPTLYLARGGSYEFEVAQAGTGFWIQTETGTSGLRESQKNISTREILGVVNNGEDVGTVTFNVPAADAQSFFTDMTTVAEVDVATDLTYVDLHNVPLQDIIDNYGGIDTLTELDGFDIVFLNQTNDETKWGGISLDDRYDIYRLNVVDVASTPTVQLVRIADIPDDTKVLVKQGVEYGNREVYKNPEKKLAVVPVITASLDILYYQDGSSADNFGRIVLVDNTSSAVIDLNEDVLGKINYTSPNGITFTNGLKVEFDDSVEPASYANKSYYVEGVGKSITLVDVDDLITPEPYTKNASEGFDTLLFDEGNFDGSLNQPLLQDYIVVNRASEDLNAWTRTNRWFHRSVIEETQKYNNFIPIIDETQRAKRPIIEFLPNLRLYNMAGVSRSPVTIVDDTQTDAFTNVNGKTGYFADGVEFNPGITVIFTNDDNVKDKIYRVDFIDQDADDATDRIINLVEIDTVADDVAVLSTLGATNQAKTFYYKNGTWQQAQAKTELNQAPLFDVFDPDGVSFGDTSRYTSSNFTGSRLFGYKVNNNVTPDTILGFGLTYKNFGNIGDIVFENDFVDDSFRYVKGSQEVSVILKSGQVRQKDSYINGWTKILENSKQYQIVHHTVDTELRSFEIGVTPQTSNSINLLQVYVNSEFKSESNYVVSVEDTKSYVIFNTNRQPGDIVTIRAYTDEVNPLGYYEVPANLENNADNDDFVELTLGQVRNHLVELSQYIPQFTGKSLGQNNLRDLNYAKYPGKILQHSAGNILPTYLLTDQTANVVDATVFSMEEYTRFKNRFVDNIDKLDIDLEQPDQAVDRIIEFMLGSKTDEFPFYYSDMIPWGDQKSVSTITVDDASERVFEISSQFDLTSVSQRGVLVYHIRGRIKRQLVEGDEYSFNNDIAEFILVNDFDLAVDDVLEIHEYTNTDGSFVPPTPTKLGLWPKFSPQYLLEENFGIQVSSIGPFKVFGTSDPEYTQPAAGLTGFWYPLYTTKSAAETRDTELGGSGVAHAHRFVGTDKLFWMPVSSNFHGAQDDDSIELYPALYPVVRGHDGSKWVGHGDIRDLVVLEYERRVYNNIKTQYNENLFDWSEVISGYWRSTVNDLRGDLNILRSMYGAWAIKNRVDITANTTYDANLPFTWNHKNGGEKLTGTRIPGGWRGIYKWMYDTETPHLTPWEMLGLTQKPDWWDDRYGAEPYTSGNTVLWEDLRDGKLYSSAINDDFVIKSRYARPRLTEVIPVDEQGRLKAPSKFLTLDVNLTNAGDPWGFGDYAPQETAWRNSSEHPFAMQVVAMLKKPSKYLSLMFDTNLFEKNTEFDQYLQKAKTYRPQVENYRMHGVMDNGAVNRVEGYNQFITNYLKYYSFSVKDTENRIRNLQLNLVYKMAGYTDKKMLKIVAENTTPTSSNQTTFIPDENYDIFLNKSTPLERVFYSGVKVTRVIDGYKVTGYDYANPFFKIIPSKKSSDSTTFTIGNTDDVYVVYGSGQNFIANIPYGTVFRTEQQIVDFLVSYQRYLNSRGIVFENTLGETPVDFVRSAKEFVFWTDQNWNVGSSIALSPSFNELTVNRQFTTTDDFTKGISIRDINGKAIRPQQFRVERVDNKTTIKVDTEQNFIYSAVLDPIQYEHVLVLDNTTIFNDIIYQPQLGNRQDRVKIIGTKAGSWNGTLHAPGFIVSDQNFEIWQAGKDYQVGDYVSFRKKIYVAKENHSGTVKFDFNNWLLVDNIRTGLLPNAANRSTSFENFFDVDDLNLESGTDSAGKGLIGFRNRSYLENLGLDDVSQVKFYQGLLKTKGTPDAINKLISADLTNLDQEIEFFEEWGFRVGEYGSTDSNQVIEFIINEQTTQDNPILVEFLNTGDVRDSTRETYLEKDLYKIPNKYSKNIFSARTADTKQTDLNSAGFPRLDDVDFTLFDIEDFDSLTASLNLLGRAKKVWVARNGNDWDVLRVSETNDEIISVTASTNGFLNFTTDKNHGLAKDQLVVIKTNELFGGVYRIREITGPRTFVVDNTKDINVEFEENIDGTKIPYYIFETSRFSQPSDIASVTPLYGYDEDEIIWVDKNQNNRWAAYQKNNPWSRKSPTTSTESSSAGRMGESIAVSASEFLALVGVPADEKAVSYVLTADRVFVEDRAVTQTDIDGTVTGFGSTISIGTNMIAIGAPETDGSKGVVFVYERLPSGDLQYRQALYVNGSSGGELFGDSLRVSQNDRYLFVGASGADTVYVYGLQTVFSIDEQLDTVVGDGSTTVFTLNFTPDNTYSINVVDENSKVYIPFDDYTISGDQITFATAPVNNLDIVVREQSHFVQLGSISGSDTQAGDAFGSAVDTDIDGRTIVVGAPNADVIYAEDSSTKTNAGEAYVFEQSVEVFFGDGVTTDFTTEATITDVVFVEVNGDLQLRFGDRSIGVGEDSSIYQYNISSNTVQFYDAPATGDVVRVYTGTFNEVQTLDQNLNGEVPSDNENFGASVSIDPYGAIIAVGAPGEDETKPNTGSAFIFVDAGLRYGTVTTDSENSISFTSGDSLFINDILVDITSTGTDASVLATLINDTDIVNVTASNTGSQLIISTTSNEVNRKIRVRPGSGTSYRVGMNTSPYAFAQKISHPGKLENENFGKVVEFDKHVKTDGTITQNLVVTSDRASTFLRTDFDVVDNETTTTFDANSTRYVDRITESGAAYVYELLLPIAESVLTPPQYAFIQQLTSTKINRLDEFGYAVAYLNDKILVGSPSDDEYLTNAGSYYEFSNPNLEGGWNLLREESDKVDVELINRIVDYNTRTNQIVSFLDYIDPFKLKVSGIAESELDYITSYDPAVYSVGEIAQNTVNPWNNEHVGRVWWDLSTVSVIEYEQGDLDYRNEFWGTFFPGSSIDVYEWVESEVLPSLYVENGGEGEPKNPDNSNYSESQVYDSRTDSTVTRYYFWVKNKNSVPNVGFRNISTSEVANLIEDPRSQGIKFAQIIAPNAVSFVNVSEDLEDRNTVFSINYDVIKNEGVLHSEFELVSQKDPTQPIPNRIYQKLIDSLAGQDSQGNTVPNPFLSDNEKYGVLIRPRQGLFVNRYSALRVFVDYCNKVFADYPIARQADLTKNLLDADPEPTISSGDWDERVSTVTERDFINKLLLPTGYTVLVANDETQKNKWTIYELQSDDSWFLKRIQAYDTSFVWNYKTWYAEGFDEFTIPLYQVDIEADLLVLNANVGEVARVLRNDNGNFSFFELQDNGTWREVIIENGTIEFSADIYNEATTKFSFDEESFDLNEFDSIPVNEVRNLVNAVKNDIFIDELAINFNELFFRLIEFALDEQQDLVGHPDWVIKTSFIKVLHKLRNLDQYPTLRNDNDQFIEEFINEVKPYKTQIREYVSRFEGNDPFEGDVTDFDVHSFYDENLEIFRKPSGDYSGDEVLRQQGLNQPWWENYSYYLSDIEIYAEGTGFIVDPIITIDPPELSTGVQATAIAVSNGNIITRVEITNPGSGYITTPQITVNGAGTGAVLLARMANDTNREFDLTIKLDRYTYSTTVQDWEPDTTYAENDLVSYKDPVTGIQEVYQVTASSSFTTGSTFEVEDSEGITVLEVYADENFTNNADRIAAYYTPTSGMLGDDLSLVQRGTVYPGVQVQGASFSAEPGFDVAAFDIEPFDNLEIDLDGLAVLAGANSLDTIISSEFTDVAIGTRPEDIDINGGKYVDTYSSHAPEELIPGRVFDTLDMEVYTDPSDDFEYNGNSFEIVYRSYNGDGTTTIFEYASSLKSEDVDSIYVYVDDVPQRTFAVDYENRTITLSSAPSATQNVYIYGYGTTGEKMTHEESFVGDGSTINFVTGVNISLFDQSLVLVNGVKQEPSGVDYELFDTDGKTVVSFVSAPAANSHIHVFAFDQDPARQAFTEVHTQEITLDGSTTSYNLDKTVQYTQPLEGNTVVELNNLRLRPTNSKHYTGDGTTATYAIPTTAGEGAAVVDGDIKVSVIPAERPTELFPPVNKVPGVDYTVDPSDGSSARTVTFNTAPESGSTVIVTVRTGADYFVDGDTITLNSSVSFVAGDKLYVTTFANHDPLRIHTKVFKGLGSAVATTSTGFDETGFDSGTFDAETTIGVAIARYEMDRTPTNANYLWVTLNGVRLHPGQFEIDDQGRINLENEDIDVNSVVVVTHFVENVIQPTIGFRIFKNMLDDFTYYRLASDFTTELAQDLYPADEKIYLVDASKLPEATADSRTPGVVFIGDERITYWEINYDENYITNIRRSTAGTRWAEQHSAGSKVVDASLVQALPETTTHTKVWYNQGSGTAADGLGLQSSASVNAEFLKAAEAALPNYIAELDSGNFVEDGYVEDGYVSGD